MIYTLSLNPAIDRMYYVPNLTCAAPIRTDDYHVQAGGKGINVVKVLRQLQEPTTALGFLGGAAGTHIEQTLKALGATLNFTPIKEETRTCLAFQDQHNQTLEVLETGPTIQKKESERLKKQLKKTLPKNSILVISGSLPKNIDDDFYFDIIQSLKENAIDVILDTSGIPLRAALAAKPYLVKPNLAELIALTDTDLSEESAQLNAMQTLLDQGAQNVVLSLGEGGALFANHQTSYKITVPKIATPNPIGSGDSFIAGFAYALKHGYNIREALRFASALGVSNAKNKEIGKIEVEDLEILQTQITVKKR